MPPAPPDDDDAILLREYCADRAEPPFRTLVERRLPAVWSAARRMVNGDAALAEDIAQEVFAHLAVHAPKLPPRVVLGGWLHRHTCFTAAKAVRAASRRRAREQQAAAMTASDASDPWPDIVPHLDAALNSLPAADRDAVVLRFFEKRDFRAIATALGTSEDAARMRTTRAVEKLRGILGKRGALLTVGLLTSLLGEKSIAAPPAHVAAKIVRSSLAHAAPVPAVTGLTALLASLRLHRAALLGGAALIATGFAIWQWQAWLTPDKSPPALTAPVTRTKAPASSNGPPVMEFTVHFIRVPETEAAALMDDRWNGDKDSALLKSLLDRATTNPDGLHVARVLTGNCVSGNRIKLENVKEFSYPTGFDPGENGVITPDEFTVRDVGTTATLELTVSETRDLCDVNMELKYDFAEPEIHRWSTSLADPENKKLPGADQPEFRFTRVGAQMMLPPGASGLAHCSQLPRLPGASPQTSDQRLFVFVTVQPAPQP